MSNWEFLLQKEGDRSWLPLDSPDVEILEGRYRLVARSNQPNVDIEIRVTHIATEEIPPKRRVQKRSGRTNQDGLMVVIPFTRLEPGLWELRCSPSDLMSELLEGAKLCTVQLQVLAHETETEDWDSEWMPASDLDDAHYQAEFAEAVRALTDTMPTDDATTLTDDATVTSSDEPAIALGSSTSDANPTPQTHLASQNGAAAAEPPPVVTAPEPISSRQVSLPPEVAQLLSASIDSPTSDANPTPQTHLTSQNGAAAEPPPVITAPEPISSRQVSLPPEVAQLLSASMDRFLDIAEQLSNQLVDEVLQDFDLSDLTPTPSAATVPDPSLKPEIESDVEELGMEVGIEPSLPPIAVPSVGASRAIVMGDLSIPTALDSIATSHAPISETPEVSEPAVMTSVASSEPPTIRVPANASLSIELEQEMFLACRGDVLTLSGRVEAVPSGNESGQVVPSVPRGKSDTPELWGFEEPHASFTEESGAIVRELQLCLRDPQSLEMLFSDRQPLTSQVLPFAFSLPFTLPASTSTRLILGEVLLCGSCSDSEEKLVTLTTQAFTITVDPKELLGELARLNEVIENNADDEETQGQHLDLPHELHNKLLEEEKLSLSLSFLEPEEVEAPAEPARKFASLAGQPLPPQIYRPAPEQLKNKSLDLPTFTLVSRANDSSLPDPTQPNSASSDDPIDSLIDSPIDHLPLVDSPSVDEPTATSVPAVESSTTSSDNQDFNNDLTSELAQTQAELAASSAAGGLDDQIEVADGVVADGAAAKAEVDHAEVDDAEEHAPAPDEAIALPSPSYMSFQALKLQDRFLTRLTSIATDAELSALLKSASPSTTHSKSPAPAPSALSETVAEPQPITVLHKTEADLVAGEVVVSDESPTPSNVRHRLNFDRTRVSANPVPQPPAPLVLSEDEPVPTPILEVTTGELVAGQPINIRLKLPSLLPRIYVKLWVTDRETRSLLDGPRWLVDFLPNGFGDLEATTPLTVPFGSLEIRFEAIAVEMQTQRESHKITVDRKVVPPNLPTLSLDDFDAEYR